MDTMRPDEHKVLKLSPFPLTLISGTRLVFLLTWMVNLHFYRLFSVGGGEGVVFFFHVLKTISKFQQGDHETMGR
jgi:hypothetical protein